MRHVLLLALAACGAKPTVATWTTTGPGLNERIEVQRDGHVKYTSSVNGVENRSEEVALNKEQVEEIDELFRSHDACKLAHDPAYTPQPDEGKTTLVLAFPEQRCTIELWNREWERPAALPVSETMRSMRPLRGQRPSGRIR
jgi:hypothetical protein